MKRSNSKIAVLTYAALLALALLWVGGAVSAPLFESAPAHGKKEIFMSKGSLSISPVYYVYSQVCHQIAERSFFLAGQPLAVCARCMGIYTGGLAALILYPLARSIKRTDAPRRLWFVVALIPMAVDFAGNYAGLFENTLASRAITGLIAGAGAAFYILPGLVSAALGWFGRSNEVMRSDA
ncbi:MAG: DUF2085 domain-containing protein [Blastocatellia bacterium]|nr:DUF2085 domain-containing protein [Blastocatellia bacterium]